VSATSSIEWTDATWNPTTGCTKVSPGCAHCYIERTPAFRIPGRRFVNGRTDLQLHHERLKQPLHWKKPRRVFVNSLSDLFHDDVPDTFISQVFAVMALTPRHTYQVLTKRPERMRAFLANETGYWGTVWSASMEIKPPPPPQHWYHAPRTFPWPLPNVWLGVSVESRRWKSRVIPHLVSTAAAVRFVSVEPLLEDLGDISDWFPREREVSQTQSVWIEGVNWVIVGGESGPGARPFDLAWARAIVQQCKAAGVPVFVKQLGSHAFEGEAENDGCGPQYFTHHKKGGDPDEWPVDLRVREWPLAHAP